MILAKATALFAAHGFAGTSTNDIVAAAGVNKRMLYHYFGDKQGLYKACFERLWQGLAGELVQKVMAGDAGSTTKDLLRSVLTVFHDFMAQHLDFVRLFMWDSLEGATLARSLWRDVRGPIYQQMQVVVQAAQREGHLDPAFDSGMLMVMFLGAITYYFAAAPALEEIVAAPPLSPKASARYRAQLLLLLDKLA